MSFSYQHITRINLRESRGHKSQTNCTLNTTASSDHLETLMLHTAESERAHLNSSSVVSETDATQRCSQLNVLVVPCCFHAQRGLRATSGQLWKSLHRSRLIWLSPLLFNKQKFTSRKAAELDLPGRMSSIIRLKKIKEYHLHLTLRITGINVINMISCLLVVLL